LKPTPLILYLLFGLLLNLLNLLLVVILIEAASRDLVQSQDRLVGVLDEDELALLALEAHVGNGADDTPAVGEGQVHLVGEVAGLPADDAKNNVLIVSSGAGAGNESVGNMKG
jgi:hypothetical protein